MKISHNIEKIVAILCLLMGVGAVFGRSFLEAAVLIAAAVLLGLSSEEKGQS